ncbi:hypothetical protein KM043_010577 [Ampulex compressa]|nr:hypothetical protein KM043_010577 [Ampulex compressa]
MGAFQFGRVNGFPSQYLDEKSAVTIDVTDAIFIAIFIIIGVAYFSIVPGYSKKRSIYMMVKVTFSVTIGCLLIVENFGQEWEVGFVKAMTPYRAGQGQEIDAEMGVKIGFRSVNITLYAKPEIYTPLGQEKINYNERFWWTWDQGRLGFGPYAGLLQRSLREAQRRGLPIPILWIAEYFTIDGEGIRFGRFYRTAGWYCHILLWTAFAIWILANIFLQTVGRYAAYSIGTVGGIQLLACIVWISVHNPNPLVIPFADKAIRMHLGVHFWMTLVCGVVCLLLAMILIFMDLRHPNALSAFLGIDPLGQYDECVCRFSELEENLRNKIKIDATMEMGDMSHSSQASRNNGMRVLKRRSTIKNAQKSLFRAPVPVTIEEYDDVAIYENHCVVRPPLKPVQNKPEEPQEYRPPIPRKVKKVKKMP